MTTLDIPTIRKQFLDVARPDLGETLAVLADALTELEDTRGRWNVEAQAAAENREELDRVTAIPPTGPSHGAILGTILGAAGGASQAGCTPEEIDAEVDAALSRIGVDPDQPSTPAEALDLDAVESRAAMAAPSRLRTAMGCIPDGQIRQGCIVSDGDTIREAIRAAAKLAFKDVPALVAEVRRLHAELDGTETQ